MQSDQNELTSEQNLSDQEQTLTDQECVEYLEDLERFAIESERFHDELARAIEEFFNVPVELAPELLTEDMFASMLDWFIFDRKLARESRTPFEIYVAENEAEWPEERREIFRKFHNNVYSFFEIIKILDNKSVMIRDMLSLKEYELRAGYFIAHVDNGWCFVGRILPFKQHHVLSGYVLAWGPDTTERVRDVFDYLRASGEPLEKLNPVEVHRMVSSL